MVGDFAKACLHEELNWAREALVWKLDGLSDYDIRRPLTATGTNLLGLVKHTAIWEARYFGEVFSRPFPEPIPRWQDADGTDLWVTPDQSREQVIDFHRRTRQHADATINDLDLAGAGHVPWWPRPHVNLFTIIVHVLNDTTRHAGHADILREGLDGQTGDTAGRPRKIDTVARNVHWNEVEQAARAATE